MTFIEEVQPLIDWCTQPHPQEKPRLKRVASAVLARWRQGDPADPYDYWGRWDGPLVYWPPRGRHFHGGFSGVLSRLEPEHQGEEAHVWLTLAEDKTWIGIQGTDIGDEWREDVFAHDRWVNGKTPENFYSEIQFYSVDRHGHGHQFNLYLTPSYLYGG